MIPSKSRFLAIALYNDIITCFNDFNLSGFGTQKDEKSKQNYDCCFGSHGERINVAKTEQSLLVRMYVVMMSQQ